MLRVSTALIKMFFGIIFLSHFTAKYFSYLDILFFLEHFKSSIRNESSPDAIGEAERGRGEAERC
jgi:hypothetical protein